MQPGRFRIVSISDEPAQRRICGWQVLRRHERRGIARFRAVHFPPDEIELQVNIGWLHPALAGKVFQRLSAVKPPLQEAIRLFAGVDGGWIERGFLLYIAC